LTLAPAAGFGYHTRVPRDLQRICVFCGSSSGARPDYTTAATALGSLMAARGIGLVYGGGNVGLMGTVADAVLAGGGEVVGVIPGGLVAREVAHRGLTELRVVDSMHERKQLMHELSDGFVAMPGGLGTLEELFETLTWAQLGIHDKPSALLNVAGYWDGLLTLLDHMVTERLVRPEHRAALLSAGEPEAMLAAMAAYQAPTVAKWLSPGQS
jgi:uncharacterized protein (TIGR00730 family)